MTPEEITRSAQYEAAYGKGPHLTVDAVVESEFGHVLMVKRRDNGLWALPGGFVEPRDTLLETARKETMEETGVDLWYTKPIASQHFDDPDRDPRSRIVTVAFHFKRNKVDAVAGDDAVEAAWLELDHIWWLDSIGEIYADHDQIIWTFCNRRKRS